MYFGFENFVPQLCLLGWFALFCLVSLLGFFVSLLGLLCSFSLFAGVCWVFCISVGFALSVVFTVFLGLGVLGVLGLFASLLGSL